MLNARRAAGEAVGVLVAVIRIAGESTRRVDRQSRICDARGVEICDRAVRCDTSAPVQWKAMVGQGLRQSSEALSKCQARGMQLKV
jgi:hypothetical protein